MERRTVRDMTRERERAKRGRVLDLALTTGSVALLIVGFSVTGSCGGGLALIAFGAATGVLATVVARMGGLVVVLPAALVIVTLVWAGLLFASETGCVL